MHDKAACLSEDVIVEALRVGAGEDERNATLVHGKLLHPFEGLGPIRRIAEYAPAPRTMETAAHIGIVMHKRGGTPRHDGWTAWVKVKFSE
jgi:hypothetical protein